jgi:formyltetrahydrofolate-dependent phosphoribosylglycinamide formyltransferase
MNPQAAGLSRDQPGNPLLQGSGSGKPRFVILVSGRGSNLQAFLDASLEGRLDAEAVLVVSSEPEAPALGRARKAGVPALAFPYRRESGLDKDESRQRYDAQLADLVEPWKPDYVFLLGWMRILGNAFIRRFPGRIYNLHPALPGSFPGTNAIQRAWDAWREGKIDHSGVMVHLVPDEGVDTGPVLEMERMSFKSGESLEKFEDDMHRLEHRLVVRAAARLAADLRKNEKDIIGG